MDRCRCQIKVSVAGLSDDDVYEIEKRVGGDTTKFLCTYCLDDRETTYLFGRLFHRKRRVLI